MHHGLSRLRLRAQFVSVRGRRIRRRLQLVDGRRERAHKYVLLDYQTNSDGIYAHGPQVRACPFFFDLWRTYRNKSTMQPLLFPDVKRLRAAKQIIDRTDNQLVAKRELALLREQSSEVKEKLDTTGRDLSTLLVRANLRDADGMSDSDVRARKASPRALSSSL